MEPQESLALLQNISGPSLHEDEALALLKDLGHLPLAIDQAATFMAETGRTVKQYRSLFDKERSLLLKKYPSTQYNVNGRENVMTTWEISFRRVEEEHPAAATLLLMFAILHNEQIPYEILESCLNGERYFCSSGELGAISDSEHWIPYCIRTALTSELVLWEEIAALRKYSLIRPTANSSALYVHPLVHFWASQRLETNSSLKQELVYCVLGLIGSAFEKQDRLPPFSRRTYGSRGLEEAKLGIWPIRRYMHLAPQALHSLRHAQGLIALMPSPVKCLTMSLLQVFEYSTYLNFDFDQRFILALLDGAAKRDEDNDGFLKWSILIWRLTRADLCKCRKGIDMNPMPEADNNQLCGRCMQVFDEIEKGLHQTVRKWGRHNFSTQRVSCILDGLLFRLAADPFWQYHTLTKAALDVPPTVDSPTLASEDPLTNVKLSDRRPILEECIDIRRDVASHISSMFQSRVAKLSWMESYGISTRRYLILRSQIEYGTNSRRNRYVDDVAETFDGLDFTKDEPVEILHSFRHLCGEQSEEYRRAAFYASFVLATNHQWEDVEKLLRPLVLESMTHPNTSWSHERCIIRFIEALVRQNKDVEAKKMVSEVQASYSKGGKTLVTVERSHLLHDATEDDACVPKKDIQIFVKRLNGSTLTVDTNTCATVRSVMTEVYDSEGIVRGEARLIYGGKQLELDRFLSDYNIQKEATLHLVLRLHGGSANIKSMLH